MKKLVLILLLLSAIVTDAQTQEQAAPVIYSHEKNIIITLPSPSDASVTIYDVTGKLIKSIRLFDATNTIDINLPGIYIVRITYENEVIVRKVWIK